MYPNKLLSKPLPKLEQEFLINSFKNHLLRLNGIVQLYLIGSASTLNMTDASDLDFIAIFNSYESLNEGKRIFYSSPRPVDWPCDVLWYSADQFEQRVQIGGICSIAEQEGIKFI